ncbi:MAG: nif-specific transcriptional activator NifA [bacterium]|nr:nif-specific transcriptional activator NifA [bacterium]
MSDQLDLERKLQELTALYEISRDLAMSFNLKSTCQKVMEVLSQILGMTRGVLILRDMVTDELAIEVIHGFSQSEIADKKNQVVNQGTTKVFQSGLTALIPRRGNEPILLTHPKSVSKFVRQEILFICVPIKVNGETLGVLGADRLFTENTGLAEDIRVLNVIASLIAQAVKLNQMITESQRNLLETNLALKQELKSKYKLENVIGTSKRMQEVFALVEQVSKSKVTVLLRGESGTGKELIAHAIHYHSPRAEQPFIKLSCAALPETLLESELFGHEKGAFTGAIKSKPGRFELADGGTLFLDEIGDIPLTTQVKLLRVLQEKKFERVGGTKTISVDVRIIAATNRDLETAIRQKQFREDLYYRLNVVPIFIPPLRDRKEDIPALVDSFLTRFNLEYGKELRISPEALYQLERYPWPGNVRELENCIERLVVQTRGDVIQPNDLPIQLQISALPETNDSKISQLVSGNSLLTKVEELEKEQITAAMIKCGGVQARAARLLGITPRQLQYKLKKYRISIPPV